MRTLKLAGLPAAIGDRQPKRQLFYVLFPPSGEVTAALDTIRYLANPRERWPVHITVRGPYGRQLPSTLLAQYNRELHGNKIEVSGVGHFVSPAQYTVFLACDGSRLKYVWAKSDYGYHPHLTLYDGGDAEIASDIERVVRGQDFRWSFRSDKLQALVGSNEWARAKMQQRFDLLLSFRSTLGKRIGASSISASDAASLPWNERIALIETLFVEAAAAATR